MKMEIVEAMEEETQVQVMREKNRSLVFLNRKRLKDDEIDMRRSLANTQLTHSSITAIANKLKTKSSISAWDLKLLQNALIDEPKTAEVVLSTHGALRGLVRELTGNDVNKQLAACGCLCNLTLGDSEKVACTVAKAAGAYLVVQLGTLTTQLAVNSAWALGNISACGARGGALAAAGGALGRLCGAPLPSAALYALTHAAYTLQDELSSEHLKLIIQCLSKTELNEDSSQLLFIVSCHKDFSPEIVPADYILSIIEKVAGVIENHLGCNITDENSVHECNNKATSRQCLELHHLLRVLANLHSDEVYSVFLNRCLTPELIQEVMRLSDIGQENRSLTWLLGNMYCRDSGNFFWLLNDV